LLPLGGGSHDDHVDHPHNHNADHDADHDGLG
jgi:hypothetical protein